MNRYWANTEAPISTAPDIVEISSPCSQTVPATVVAVSKVLTLWRPQTLFVLWSSYPRWFFVLLSFPCDIIRCLFPDIPGVSNYFAQETKGAHDGGSAVFVGSCCCQAVHSGYAQAMLQLSDGSLPSWRSVTYYTGWITLGMMWMVPRYELVSKILQKLHGAENLMLLLTASASCSAWWTQEGPTEDSEILWHLKSPLMSQLSGGRRGTVGRSPDSKRFYLL